MPPDLGGIPIWEALQFWSKFYSTYKKIDKNCSTLPASTKM
jgi:hypothetical protein